MLCCESHWTQRDPFLLAQGQQEEQAVTPLAAEMPTETWAPALPGSAQVWPAALRASPGHGSELPAQLQRGRGRCHHRTFPLASPR